jgi:hypothetical protein
MAIRKLTPGQVLDIKLGIAKGSPQEFVTTSNHKRMRIADLSLEDLRHSTHFFVGEENIPLTISQLFHIIQKAYRYGSEGWQYDDVRENLFIKLEEMCGPMQLTMD